MTNAPTGFLWREWTHCVFYKHKPQNEYPKIIPKITTVSINPKIRHNTMWFFLKDEEMIDYRVSQNCDKKPGTARCTICSQIHCCTSPLWQEAETIRRSTLLFNISLLSSWQEEEETIIGGVVGKRSPQAQGTYITWAWKWFWFYCLIDSLFSIVIYMTYKQLLWWEHLTLGCVVPFSGQSSCLPVFCHVFVNVF